MFDYTIARGGTIAVNTAVSDTVHAQFSYISIYNDDPDNDYEVKLSESGVSVPIPRGAIGRLLPGTKASSGGQLLQVFRRNSATGPISALTVYVLTLVAGRDDGNTTRPNESSDDDTIGWHNPGEYLYFTTRKDNQTIYLVDFGGRPIEDHPFEGLDRIPLDGGLCYGRGLSMNSETGPIGISKLGGPWPDFYFTTVKPSGVGHVGSNDGKIKVSTGGL